MDGSVLIGAILLAYTIGIKPGGRVKSAPQRQKTQPPFLRGSPLGPAPHPPSAPRRSHTGRSLLAPEAASPNKRLAL